MMWRQYVNIWSEDVLCPVCSAKHRHFWTQWSKHSLFLQNSRETTACRLRGDCSSENILFIFPSPQYNVHPLCPLSRANSFNLQNRTVRSVTERREERDQRHCIAWSLQCVKVRQTDIGLARVTSVVMFSVDIVGIVYNTQSSQAQAAYILYRSYPGNPMNGQFCGFHCSTECWGFLLDY